jgi:hypothetical protein
MRTKRAPLAGATALVALLISGCGSLGIGIDTQTTEQRDSIGAVRVTTNLCTRQTNGSSAANPPDVCGNDDSGAYQLLLGYLLPNGVTAPDTTTADSADNAFDLTFTASPSYSSQLELYQDSGPDNRWVGYLSGVYTDDGVTPLRWTVLSDLGLPPAVDGGPFTGGPLVVQTITGSRYVPSPVAADADVNCGLVAARLPSSLQHKLEQRYGKRRVHAAIKAARSGHRTRIAIYSGGCFSDTQGSSQDTRDLGIVPLGNATGQAGTSTSVPFSVRFKGDANPPLTFSLSSPVSIAGATVTPSQATYTPATDGTQQVDVKIDLPGNTEPATYPVRLVATLPNGQKREAVAQVTVTAAAPRVLPPLVETLDDIATTSLDAIKTDGLPVTIGCNTACDATVDLLMYKPPASRAGIAKAVDTVLLGRVRGVKVGADGGKATTSIQLSDVAKQRLGRLKKFTLIVRTTAKDVSSQVTPPLLRKLRLEPNCANGETPCLPR